MTCMPGNRSLVAPSKQKQAQTIAPQQRTKSGATSHRCQAERAACLGGGEPVLDAWTMKAMAASRKDSNVLVRLQPAEADSTVFTTPATAWLGTWQGSGSQCAQHTTLWHSLIQKTQQLIVLWGQISGHQILNLPTSKRWSHTSLKAAPCRDACRAPHRGGACHRQARRAPSRCSRFRSGRGAGTEVDVDPQPPKPRNSMRIVSESQQRLPLLVGKLNRARRGREHR